MAQLYRLLPHTGSTINTFHQPMAENFDESAGKEIQGSILKQLHLGYIVFHHRK
jgi:hypothetical protein